MRVRYACARARRSVRGDACGGVRPSIASPRRLAPWRCGACASAHALPRTRTHAPAHARRRPAAVGGRRRLRGATCILTSSLFAAVTCILTSQLYANPTEISNPNIRLRPRRLPCNDPGLTPMPRGLSESMRPQTGCNVRRSPVRARVRGLSHAHKHTYEHTPGTRLGCQPQGEGENHGSRGSLGRRPRSVGAFRRLDREISP